jgi:hypothetical protein
MVRPDFDYGTLWYPEIPVPVLILVDSVKFCVFFLNTPFLEISSDFSVFGPLNCAGQQRLHPKCLPVLENQARNEAEHSSKTTAQSKNSTPTKTIQYGFSRSGNCLEISAK